MRNTAKNLIGTVIVFLLALCFASDASAWWDGNYQYRKQITATNNDSIQLAAITILYVRQATALDQKHPQETCPLKLFVTGISDPEIRFTPDTSEKDRLL
jgi:hypothetical protein